MRVIPSNTATAALRRIAFTLVDATDLKTPEDITVTGVKVSLSINGGTPANSTNDIVKVNGTNGEYYVELTQAEANQTAGALVRGWLTPSGCALEKIEAQIGPAEAFTAVMDEVIENSVTFRAMLRLFASVLLGKANGLAGTTANYRDLADTKNRVVATVDTDGNRTAVTLDAA